MNEKNFFTVLVIGGLTLLLSSMFVPKFNKALAISHEKGFDQNTLSTEQEATSIIGDYGILSEFAMEGTDSADCIKFGAIYDGATFKGVGICLCDVSGSSCGTSCSVPEDGHTVGVYDVY